MSHDIMILLINLDSECRELQTVSLEPNHVFYACFGRSFSQWREFAKEMDGVIRIGAVNCGDNNHLCRRKGISSYPSLFIFRAGQVRNTFSSSISMPVLYVCTFSTPVHARGSVQSVCVNNSHRNRRSSLENGPKKS